MSKIRVKIGNLEIEYEGEQEFIENGLLGLIQEMLDEFGMEVSQEVVPLEKANTPISQSRDDYSDWTTDTFANQLGINSGNDLVLAAAAKLTLIDKKTSFSRQELLDSMKEAKMFYNDNHRSNLTRYINSAVKNEVFRKVRDGYVLNREHKNRIETDLD